jgi:hypothetical protein
MKRMDRTDLAPRGARTGNRTPARQITAFPEAPLDETLSIVNPDQIDAIPVTAADARERLIELEAERIAASGSGVAGIAAYKRDLELEIRAWRRLYVTAAVTEIATLRSELVGTLNG